ncbi:MAG TPA: translation initiation factor [Vicinamibacterales bacterium]|nr:translation initiation factor [Vicinamibacterales bacterium]
MSKPFHNPFEVLGRLRGAPLPEPEPHAAPEPIDRPVKTIPRAVVRLERAGRKGKEVTVVEHLDLGAAERDVWVKALKAALGCGGSVEGTSLVLQGDHRKRLPALLAKRGVKKVTAG